MILLKNKIPKPFFFVILFFFLLVSISPLYSSQENDKEYTAKILEFTTEDFFLTELVDHLPASASIPTPEKVLGTIVGAPDILHHSKDIYKYMKIVAGASPRVKIFNIGKTDEGKDMILVAVSDEENIKRLDRIKEIMNLLADPRKVTAEKVQPLFKEGVPVYWITGGLHSRECGSPEMLMELVYRLAVEDSEAVSTIRKNLLVLVTPILEVDGWDRMVDLYRYKKNHKDKKILHDVYWGNYVYHDNNRDSIAIALKLTENVLKTYFQWHPIVMHDLHESIPYLYISTGTGPYNAWLDPITINQMEELANVEVAGMTKRGVPGVWTHGFYDGWGPSYLFYIALYHNSLGRFYETFGSTGADTLNRNVGTPSKRDWYRPNPPLKVVKWSFRNNINLQQSALLIGLKHVGKNKEKFLKEFYLKGERSIAKAVNEGPAAWVIPAGKNRSLAAAELLNLLRKHGAEIHQSDKSFTIKKDKYNAGTYIIRMDQPYSRCVDMFLDTQYYNPNDPKPYDDTGWTQGILHNVKTVRIMEKEILDVPMKMLDKDIKICGQIKDAPNTAAYLIEYHAENPLIKFRFDLKDIKMLTAEKGFKAGDKRFNAGTFIIPMAGNPRNLKDRLEKAAEHLGLTLYGVEKMPEVNKHSLAVPRIAILHTWISTQNDGWYRLAFEKLGIPYSYISTHEIRDNQKLKNKYDVIIFPPVDFFKPQRHVNGISGNSPIPWQKTKEYPNLGSPFSCNDIRGGIELEGVLNLKRFVEEGGLFIPITSNINLPIDYGIIESVAVKKSAKLRTNGTILQTRVIDRQSPVTYGYDFNLGVIFSGNDLLETGIKAVIGALDFDKMLFGEAKKPRESGRGGLKDPDVVQGRPFEPPKVVGAGTGIPPEFRDRFNLYMPPDLKRIRVLLRFDRKNKLLISGMLDGAEELQNRAALVDVPVGKGHILLFAFNPMWRCETKGNYALIFNAALNFNNLDAGRPKN